MSGVLRTSSKRPIAAGTIAVALAAVGCGAILGIGDFPQDTSADGGPVATDGAVTDATVDASVDATADAPPTPRAPSFVLSAGWDHTCASGDGGALQCWGSLNAGGQLGIGPYRCDDAGKPTQDAGSAGSLAYVCDRPLGVTLPGTTAAVSAGYVTTCAITDDRSLYCWGDNTTGAVGAADSGVYYSPAALVGLDRGVVAVSTGGSSSGSHTCAIVSPDGGASGSAMCWGSNAHGELGVAVTSGSIIPTPQPVTGINEPLSAIAAGVTHTCALGATTGSVWCWGDNFVGQVGEIASIGSGTCAPSIVTVAGAALTGATSIAVGELHSCAILGDGGVTCWGDGTHYQFGGSAASSATHGYVSFDAGARMIAAGGAFTCVVTTADAVYCWGIPGFRWPPLAGINNTALTPTEFTFGDAGAPTCVTVGSAACARLTSGDTQCWGVNAAGQFGNGALDSGMIPQSVKPL